MLLLYRIVTYNKTEVEFWISFSAPKESHMGSRSQGQSMFRVARDDAERQICEKLKYKLDEFLELENYDWLLVEPKGHASSFITDLIAFLQSIFLSFTNLPVSVSTFMIVEIATSYCFGVVSVQMTDVTDRLIISLQVLIYILRTFFTKVLYIVLCNFYLNRECINPRHQVNQMTEFYTVVPYIYVLLEESFSIVQFLMSRYVSDGGCASIFT